MKPTYLLPTIIVAALGAIVVSRAVHNATQSDPIPLGSLACAIPAAASGDATRPEGSRPADDDPACPLPSDDVALVPVPERREEPTLAPPEPGDDRARVQIIVVRAEGEVPAPDHVPPAMTPAPEPHGEPTPAPPEPPVRLARASGPQTIVVQVDAGQSTEEGLPANMGVADRPRLTAH